jgi:hypothetical protein
MSIADSKPRQMKAAPAKPRKRVGVGAASGRTRYEQDFYGWAFEQADLLRRTAPAGLDAENIAEELQDLGGSQYDKLESALTVLLMHMLKWDHQPDRRSRSWANTIRTQRRHYGKVLKANPSLKPRRDEALAEAYEDARASASSETDLPIKTFSDICAYSWSDILDRPFAIDPDDA